MSKLSVWGNQQTMNLPQVIYLNIQSSPYFKDLYRLKTYHEVLDEIYYKVEYLEPFIPGLVNIPSTAFCLLFKCFTMKITEKQMIGMLNHTDSPYIRGLGFLYLRFCCPPEQLFLWFTDYLFDEEPIFLRQKEGQTTIGAFVRQLLTEHRYCDIILPRIPVLIQKEIDRELTMNYPIAAQAPVKEKKEKEKESEEKVIKKRTRARSPAKKRSKSPETYSKSSWSRSRSPRRDRRKSKEKSPDRLKSRRSRSRSPRRRRSGSPRRHHSPHRRSKSRSPRRARSRSPRKHSSRSRSKEKAKEKSPKKDRSKTPSKKKQ